MRNYDKIGSRNRETLKKLTEAEKDELILALIAKIAELEARLNQNSSNSSKPPSSDGFKKVPKSLRKPSVKRAGGQRGHEGSGLKIEGEPDKYISHEPKECAPCQNAEICKSKQCVIETRYEIDIKVETSTIAHQTKCIICPLSKDLYSGIFPANIRSTMQYGVNMEALAISLNTIGMVSINRTHEILSGVFGVPISTGTISSMVSECAKNLAEPVREIKDAIIKEPLAHSDETGMRVNKATMWAHVISTEKLTYIDVQESRGKKGINAIGILLVFLGTLIHDCWASYFSYNAIRHGLCNAHLLRELVAVVENTGQEWAQKLIGLLLQMKKTKERFISHNLMQATSYYLKKYDSAFDAILAEALAENPVPERDITVKGRIKRGKTGALVDRLILHKEKYTLFFSDFNVPFDNNQAERDIRMFKVKQKVSGCFRTKDGAKDFATISSYVGTARKHGVSGFAAIKNALLAVPFSFKSSCTTE